MKLKYFLSSVFAASAMVCTVAQAQNTIDFQGRYESVSCTANLNGLGTASGEVVLPKIDSSQLATNNSIAGETLFSIALTGCGSHAKANAVAYFYGSATGIDHNGNVKLDSSSSGSGWAFKLKEANMSSTPNIILNTNPTPTHADLIGYDGTDVSTGSGTLDYAVSYIRNDPNPFVPGTGRGEVTYAIYYR